MSYFDIRTREDGEMDAEQLADAKHVVTVLGRYEEAEHRLAMKCWADITEIRGSDDETPDSHELFSSVGSTNGISTTRAVQYFNYADLYLKWEDM